MACTMQRISKFFLLLLVIRRCPSARINSQCQELDLSLSPQWFQSVHATSSMPVVAVSTLGLQCINQVAASAPSAANSRPGRLILLDQYDPAALNPLTLSAHFQYVDPGHSILSVQCPGGTARQIPTESHNFDSAFEGMACPAPFRGRSLRAAIFGVPPFAILTPIPGRAPGVDNQIFTLLADRMGFEFEFVKTGAWGVQVKEGNGTRWTGTMQQVLHTFRGRGRSP